jgi:transposase-like protein
MVSPFGISCIIADISLLLERFKMTTILVQCPRCGGADVIKAGKQPNGAQRYRCQDVACNRTIFQLDYSDKGRLPETKRQIVDMALNGSGVRDTARVLGIGTGTVVNALKKKGVFRKSCGWLDRVNVAGGRMFIGFRAYRAVAGFGIIF